jgi:acyl-CoA thioester hydrolase
LSIKFTIQAQDLKQRNSFMDAINNFDWSETRLRVRYAETDQAGVVYHSNYLIWFEVGRVELCRDYGFNYRDMEKEADALLPVTELCVKYRVPARYDDEILIRTRIVELRSRAIKFAYQVIRALDDALLAEGETHHIVMNRLGRARAFPPKYAELMRSGKKI